MNIEQIPPGVRGVYQNGDSIDPVKLVQAVRELAAERPDFVYKSDPYREGPGCLYTLADGTPDCIMGCAMARIGQPLPPQKVGTHEANECTLLNEDVYTWYGALGVGAESVTMKWLASVQNHQDNGYTWEAAVREADARWGKI